MYTATAWDYLGVPQIGSSPIWLGKIKAMFQTTNQLQQTSVDHVFIFHRCFRPRKKERTHVHASEMKDDERGAAQI